jgi:pimeloyl-ACP methyl ester carboxylesterase
LEKSYFSRNPDVEPLLQKLTPLLNQAPITLKTLAIDSYSVKSVPWLFSGDQLSGLLYGALYSPKSVAGFKTLLTNLDQGNLNGLDVEVTQNTVIPVELTNLGFFFAFDCNDTFSHASKAEIQKNIDANPEIGPLMYGRDLAWGAEFIDMCHLFVDPRAATPHFRTPVKSSIPVLFISGEFDPATPPENADLAAKTLSNSQVVVVPGGGHDSMFGGPCPIALTRDFLNSPFQKVDQSCLSAQADAQ